MADLPSLVTKLKMNTNEFDQATETVLKKVKHLSEQMEKTFEKMENLGKKAALGFGAVAASIGGLIFSAGKAESSLIRLEAAVNGDTKAFDILEASVRKLNKTSAENNLKIRDVTAGAYNMMKQFGFSAEQVAALIERGEAFSTVWGEDFDSVMNSLMMGLQGFGRTLKTYGIAIDDASMKQWAIENGLDGIYDSLSETEKMQLRFKVMLESTTNAMDNAGKAGMSLENTIARLKNSLIEAASNIGSQWLEDSKNVLAGIASTVEKLGESKAFASLIANLGKLALTITGVGVVIGILGKIGSVTLAALQIGIYMVTTPWILFTAAVVGGAALVILNWEKIKEVWTKFVDKWNSTDASPDALAASWGRFVNAIKSGDWTAALDEGINLVIGGVKWFWQTADKALDDNNIKDFVGEDWEQFKKGFQTGDWLSSIKAAGKLIADISWGTVTVLGNVFSSLIGVDNDKIQTAINNDFSDLRNAIEGGDILGGLKAVGKIAVDIAWGTLTLFGGLIDGLDEVKTAIDEDFQELRDAIETGDFLSGIKAVGKIAVDVVWGILSVIGKPLTSLTGEAVKTAINADFQALRDAISEGDFLAGVKAVGQIAIDIVWGGLNLFGSLLEAFGLEDVKSKIEEKIQPIKDAVAEGDLLKGLRAVGSLAVDILWGGITLAGQAISNVSDWIKEKVKGWLYGTGGFRGGRIPDEVSSVDIGWIDILAKVGANIASLAWSGITFVGGAIGNLLNDLANWIREKLGFEGDTIEADLGNDLTVILTGAIKGADIGLDWLTDKMSGLNEKLKAVVERLRNADVGKVGLDVDAQAMSDELTNFGKTLGEFVVEGFKLSVNLTDIVASAVGNAVEGLTGSEALGMVAEKGVPLYFVAKLTGLDRWAGQILQTLTFAGIVRGGSGVGSMLKSGLSAAALTMSVALVMDRVENAIAAGDLKSAIKDLALAAGIGIAGAALGGPLGGLLAFSISLYIIPKLFSDDRTVDQLYADLQDKAVAMQQALESPSIVPATYLGQVYDQIAPIQDLLVKMKDESVYERLTPMMQNEIAKLEAWVVTVVDIFNKISDGLLEVDEAIRKLKGDKTPIIVPLDVTTGAAPERSSFKEQVPLDLLPLGVGVDIGPNPFHYGAGVGLDSRMASLSPVQVITIPEAPTGEAFSQTYINELASTLEKLVQQTEVKEPARVVGAMETSEKLTYADVKGFSLGKVDPMVLFAWAMAESDSLRLNQVSSDNLGLGPWQFGRSTWEQVEVNRRLNTGLPYEEGVTTAATATQAAEEYINYLRTYSTLQFTEATKLFAGWNAGPGWVGRNFPDSTDLEALPVETMRLMTRFMLSMEELTGGDWSQLSGLSDEWRSFVEDTADTVNRLVEEFGDKVSNQFPGGEPYTFDLSEVVRRLEEIPEAAITPDINIETPAIEIPEAPNITVEAPTIDVPEASDVTVEAPTLEVPQIDFTMILEKLDEIKAIVQEFYVEPGIKGEEIKAILQEFYVEPDSSGANENLSGIESAIDEVGKILGSLQFPVTDLTGVIEVLNGLKHGEPSQIVIDQDLEPLLSALESLKASIIEGNATLNSIFNRLGTIRDKLWSFGGGFSSGGFTSGRKEEVAGVVHGGEWVAPKWLVESEPELFAKLESMRKGVPGYEVGGPVDIKIPVLRNFAEGGTVEMPDFVGQSIDMFKPIMLSISSLFKGIMSIVVKVADAILNAVAKIIEALGGDSALVQDIKDAMKSLSKMADDIDSDLKEVFDLFGEVQGEMSGAAKILEKAGQALGGPFGLPKGLGIPEDAGIFERLFGGPFNSLRKKIEEIVSSLGLFEEQSNALKEQFDKVMASLMSGDVKGAAIGADSLVTGALAMIPTIMEGIAAVFGGLEAMLGPVGAAIAVVTVGLGLLGGLLLKASGAIEAFKKGMDTTLSPVLARLARPFERLGNELGRVLIPVIEFLIPVIEALAAAVKGVINFVIDAINVAIDILNMIPFVNLEKLSRLGDLEQPEPEHNGGNLAGWHQPVTNNFNVTFTGNTVLDTDDEAMKQLWEKFLRYAREHGVEVVV